MSSDEIKFTGDKKHFQRYLDFAVSILEKYTGEEPFHIYLKKYFSVNKKHGSRDRKHISALCYHYFRIGNGVIEKVGIKEKILIADFLLSTKSPELLKEFQPQLFEYVELALPEKIEKISSFFSLENIFPFNKELSGEINATAFNLSFLKQPKLFVRIRPGNALKVLNELNAAGISFERITENCLAFDEKEKISDFVKVDKEVVIQDYNSQRVAEFFLPLEYSEKQPLKIWDCCAASGGKSILAFDFFKNILLTATDVRKNILINLKQRFQRAGLKYYHAFVADVSSTPAFTLSQKKFDLIIADVPCSGSGTWSRTPEQLLYFPTGKINDYVGLQRNIVMNAQEHLEENGYFLYVTCSVFKKENEDNVQFFVENLPLQLMKSDYLEGYEMQADTLFAALFQKKTAKKQ